MPPMIFEEVSNTDSARKEFIRRTKTICIYTTDRPGIASKSLVKLVTTIKGSDRICAGVFCVDAAGSKKGRLIGHTAHFPGLATGEELDVELSAASAQDCVEWLEENDDPERKVFGHILKTSIDSSEEMQRLSQIAKESLETSKKNLEKAENLADSAEEDRLSARADRKKGIIYAVSGFILGALFDIGMLEEKFDLEIPKPAIIGIFILAIVMAGFAAKWARTKPKPNSQAFDPSAR